jgi:hypothetical protein
MHAILLFMFILKHLTAILISFSIFFHELDDAFNRNAQSYAQQNNNNSKKRFTFPCIYLFFVKKGNQINGTRAKSREK